LTLENVVVTAPVVRAIPIDQDVGAVTVKLPRLLCEQLLNATADVDPEPALESVAAMVEDVHVSVMLLTTRVVVLAVPVMLPPGETVIAIADEAAPITAQQAIAPMIRPRIFLVKTTP
jgi:hypothetical protein